MRKMAGEESSAAPILHRLMVSNGSCDPSIPVGTPISDGGNGTPCTTIPKKDLLVMVDTSRGMCAPTAAYPKTNYSISGTVTLDGDRQITSDIVEFTGNGRIVTNGHSLTITADEVRMDQNGEIKSFAGGGPQRSPGSPGSSGGTLLMRAKTFTGSDLRIDLSGQDGVKGATGGTGAQGPHGVNGRGHGLQGLRGCGGGNASTPGGPGGPGKDGLPGGPGGNGGTVVVQLADGADPAVLTRLIVVGKDGQTLPGKGGDGGDGGQGGPGGIGGSGDTGHNGCGGTPGSPNGPQGPRGPQGIKGADGTPGPITLQ